MTRPTAVRQTRRPTRAEIDAALWPHLRPHHQASPDGLEVLAVRNEEDDGR